MASLMADPPKIRGASGSTPPPPPTPERSSASPEVSGPKASTVTGRRAARYSAGIEIPDPDPLRELIDLVNSEAAALLSRNEADRLMNLHMRAALAAWMSLRQPETVTHHLELAVRHPMAPRLRFSIGLTESNVESLAAAQASIGAGVAAAIAVDVTEAWLFRYNRPAEAAAVVDAISTKDLPTPLRMHVLELAALAHAAAGNWGQAIKVLHRALTDSSPPADLAATAALVLDRSNDPAGALALCWKGIERVDATPLPRGAASHVGGAGGADPVAHPVAAGWRETPAAIDAAHDPGRLGLLRLLDVAIEAASRCDDGSKLELLQRRHKHLLATSESGLDVLATRSAIASELARRGQHALAAETWIEIAEAPHSSAPEAARRVATYAAVLEAAAAGNTTSALAIHRRLMSAGDAAVVASHSWRAMELAALSSPSERVTEGTPETDHAARTRMKEWWLDLHDIANPTSTSVARLEARGGLKLRWAATLAERLDNRATAIELWRRAAQADHKIGSEYDHLARIIRDAARPGGSGLLLADAGVLLQTYDVWASSQADPSVAAALHCARGIVDVQRGRTANAEEAFRRAAQLDPNDPVCLAALAALYRVGRRYDALATVLSDLSKVLVSRNSQAATAREHADVLAHHLADRSGAQATLERSIAEHPDDGEAMLALAQLYDGDEHWKKSIAMLQRAVALPAMADRKADIWSDISRREESRGNQDAALAALAKAVKAAPQRADLRREQARIYRQSGRFDKALQVVRAELKTDPAAKRRVELKHEEAQLLAALDRGPEAVTSYLDVLSADPEHAEAIAGLEPLARRLGMWSELARAFRSAPTSPHNLEVLAEALQKTAQWRELTEVRQRQLDSAATPAEKAQWAAEVATLFEHQLDDRDGAIRMLTIAQAHSVDDNRQRDLVRLLRATERWTELAQAMERELSRDPSKDNTSDTTHRKEVLLELGALRSERLERHSDAVAAFEAALELDPTNEIALDNLEVLYDRLGRDFELARLLERRAAQTTLPASRGKLLARVAALRTKLRDVDGSVAAYLSAFQANPANRDVFTAMERVCYEAEQWGAVMQLYEIAIAQVETGKGPAARAYRLGDLYARRGSVELGSLGQTDAAKRSYQRVVEVDLNPEGAVTILEQLCLQDNDWEPLIAAWERRADFQTEPSRRVAALAAAVEVATDRGTDPRVAMRLNHKLLVADPSDARAASALASYYEAQQNVKDLIAVLKARLPYAAANETIAILNRIARASEEGARDVVAATENYHQILALDPNNHDALEALGRIYESTEQWAEFVDITRRQIAITNDRTTKALLYFRCGSVMEAKFGRQADAIRYYDAAIKATPTCLPAVHGLRDLYRRRQEWPRVIETLELEVKVWTDEKERAGVFAQIGRIYEKQLSDIDRAMTYYDSALVVDPDCLPANQAVFEHYFDRGQWDRAKPIAQSLAQKAMREGDPSTRSEFHRKRGVVALNTFEPKAAAESFIVALEIKPANSAALDDLGALSRQHPDAWDFEATYRELEKLYKKRPDASPLLARVLVAQAGIIERRGYLDGAASLYRQALDLAPADFTVLSAVIDFHVSMRQWTRAIAAIERFIADGASASDRVSALMRLAMIYAEGEMDPPRAIDVLVQVLELDPSHQAACYELSQQYFLIGRYAEASEAIERVIELATAPGQPLVAEVLARYYYYKGRILDAAGDPRAATSQYRRTIDYDPGYAPSALVLARRAADSGDQRQAETLLIEAAHAAMAKGGPPAAIPLQRGLAHILLKSGDRRAAIEAYRGILNVEPEGADDRVALAEIYAVEDPQRAIGELRKVLERDMHHAPAYRLLASLYDRTGDSERTMRVLTTLDLLGFAEPVDVDALSGLRASRQPHPIRRSLDEANRVRLLVTTAVHEPLGEIWSALAEELTAFIAQPPIGDNLEPAASDSDPRLFQLAREVGALYSCDAEVFVGDNVPGLLAVTAFPQRLIVVDRTLCDEADQPLRFLFGYAFEAIRGGYAALFQLGAKRRRELTQLLRDLVADGAASGVARDIMARVDPRAEQILERHAGTRNLDPDAWIDSMLACAKRAGLVACDDFGSAIWMIARQCGDSLERREDTVALGAVLGGPDLIRFYLSDHYQMMRDLLSLPV